MLRKAVSLLSLAVNMMLQAGEPLNLVGKGTDGSPDYVLVWERATGVCGEYAATELQRFLKQMSGVELKIAPESGFLPEKAVVFQKAASGEGLPPDGFELRVSGRRLLIGASGGGGWLFGAYELLERFGGCGWYASWHEEIPSVDRFLVPENLDDRQIPAFEYRNVYWYDVIRHPDFAGRLRCNASGVAKRGSNRFTFCPGLGNCHTFDKLLSPAEHYDSHPEYFSERNGRRRKVNTQLCLTNPDVLRLCTDRVLTKAAEWYPKGVRYFGVSQNDNENYCQCANCRALAEREGSHAAPIILFVNAIAENLEKDYPEAVVETLAYQYSSTLPRTVRPRHNVMPCLCTVDCNFSVPLVDSCYANDRRAVENLRAWGAAASRLCVWDYTTDFSNVTLPWPNVRSLRGNCRFMKESGVSQIFAQGFYNGPFGDWAPLKAWLLGKYMWDPSADEEILLTRFFNAFYGPAASLLRQYFDAIHAVPRDESVLPMGCFEKFEESPITEDFLDWADGLLERASQMVAGTRYAFNVAIQRMCIDSSLVMKHLYSLNGGVFFCSVRPERVDIRRRERMKEVVRRIELFLARSEAQDFRFAESGNAQLVQMRNFAASATPTAAVSRVEIEERFLKKRGPTSWADYVADAKAADNRALFYPNTSYEWNGYFKLRSVITDKGASYRVRFRLRVQRREGAPLDGEVFWAGVYNDEKRRPMLTPEFSLKVRDVPDEEYHWYDLPAWVPHDCDYVWSGGGRYDRETNQPCHNGVWIDTIELIRVE